MRQLEALIISKFRYYLKFLHASLGSIDRLNKLLKVGNDLTSYLGSLNLVCVSRLKTFKVMMSEEQPALTPVEKPLSLM